MTETFGHVRADEIGELRDRVDQVLAVVEDDEAALVLERMEQRVEIVAVGLLAQFERTDHGRRRRGRGR